MPNKTTKYTTDILPYPSGLLPAGHEPPPPDPPHNSQKSLSRISPSPITVPTKSTPPLIRINSRNKLTTDLPNMSPSPITVPDSSTHKTVKFQPNLSYNEAVDICWYNNSPITKSQYNWLVDRHQNSLEIPDKFTYQTNILYKEPTDSTCWFKGYPIWCETYDWLKAKQDKHTNILAKSHKKPGLYRDPVEKISLLWLREIGEGEAAVNDNENIERDWRLLKYGPETAYRGFTVEPGKTADVLQDTREIDGIHKTMQTTGFYEDQYQLLLRNYNKDEYKTEDNNVYKKVMDAIDIVKSGKSTDEEKNNAFMYLNEKFKDIDDFIIGGKKRKQTRKRKTSKRKTNKTRKRNAHKKSQKK